MQDNVREYNLLLFKIALNIDVSLIFFGYCFAMLTLARTHTGSRD